MKLATRPVCHKSATNLILSWENNTALLPESHNAVLADEKYPD